MRIVPGPVVSKEKRHPELPDEYEEVEYLSLENEPIEYSELILPNTPESISRIKEIGLLINNIGYQYINAVPKDISIVFPSSEVSKLSVDEQRKTHKFVDSTVEISMLPPKLVRFIPQQYVNALFEKGEIMLSSFNKCKELEDSSRKDELEGRATVKISSVNSSMIIESGIGSNPLLLCSSLFQTSPDEVNNEGKYDAGFIIVKPDLLIIKIIDGLKKRGIIVNRVMFGPCHYSDRVIERYEKDLPSFVTGPSTLDFERLFQYQAQMCGPDIFFEKGIIFENEKEWRFVFFIDKSAKINSIVLSIDHPEECCLKYFKKEFASSEQDSEDLS